MNILGNIKIALRALRANMLRSSLTVLGIVIGVAAVVALLSIGRGATASITSRVSSLGSNLVTVSAQLRFGPGGAGFKWSFLALFGLRIHHLFGSWIGAIAPSYQSEETVASSTRSSGYAVSGVTPEYMTVRSYTLAERSIHQCPVIMLQQSGRCTGLPGGCGYLRWPVTDGENFENWQH